ncbi:MAG: hypothetical protein MK025_13190 [Acidobacteriia bacterium]|nr:hypothetical protein [Terriglobia bacterium]|tara:strand:+ start:6611 stop:6844 length:234 start_codon:yes stop_codon:yes gene_type:complete
MKKYFIGILLGIAICFISVQAMAEPKIVSDIKLIPAKVETWIANEKAKTISFQKKSWADGQAQITGTINKLKQLFIQ